MTSILQTGKPVAFLVPHWPPDVGGVARAAVRLAHGLSEHVAIEVLTPDARLAPGLMQEANEGRLRVLRFGAASREDAQRGFFDLVSTRSPYALIHAVYVSESGFPAVFAARHHSTPCLLAARGNDLDRDVFRGDRQAALLFALRHAEAVVGVSQALSRKAIALGASGRVVTIPNGVLTNRFQPVAKVSAVAVHLGVAGANPLLAFVGAARPKKGLATMLAAFRLVRQIRPGAKLWLIGGVRADGKALWDTFATQYPDDAARVVVTPPIPPDDLPTLLAHVDLLWHPSEADGLPNALLEAMACGKVTVATPVGGIPDVYDTAADARWGQVLVPPRTPEVLAQRTLELLGSLPGSADHGPSPQVAALAALGQAWVKTRFSPESEVRSYLDLYAALLG